MDQLKKCYVELTTACNLDCRMCVRHAWQDIRGTMSLDTARALISQLAELDGPPCIHFGGFGEPTVHPHFLQIVREAKQAGLCVELTTNGTRLNRIIAVALVDLGVDRIIVSIDGVTRDHYGEIRIGADYDAVIDNMRDLYRLKLQRSGRRGKPRIELAFTAMKRNVEDIPLLPRLATAVGAQRVIVSNVIPHTPELEDEILYRDALRAPAYRASGQVIEMSLPRLDINNGSSTAFSDSFQTRASISLLNDSLSQRSNYCEFAHEGYTTVRWDGAVSPCLSLLHDHPEYLHGRRREITAHTLGNINQVPLSDIWTSPDYTDLRARLRDFHYSPCTTCGGCDRFRENLTDCTENPAPTCGGCLWAQGFIQCP